MESLASLVVHFSQESSLQVFRSSLPASVCSVLLLALVFAIPHEWMMHNLVHASELGEVLLKYLNNFLLLWFGFPLLYVSFHPMRWIYFAMRKRPRSHDLVYDLEGLASIQIHSQGRYHLLRVQSRCLMKKCLQVSQLIRKADDFVRRRC